MIIYHPFTAAELLRQLSRELEENSKHGPLPLSELLSASTHEVDQVSHTSYGTHFEIVNDGFS